jgi:hypothetical protein
VRTVIISATMQYYDVLSISDNLFHFQSSPPPPSRFNFTSKKWLTILQRRFLRTTHVWMRESWWVNQCMRESWCVIPWIRVALCVIPWMREAWCVIPWVRGAWCIIPWFGRSWRMVVACCKPRTWLPMIRVTHRLPSWYFCLPRRPVGSNTLIFSSAI